MDRVGNSHRTLATWTTANIGPDTHAQVDKVLFSVSWQHIGKTADVRLTATVVQFLVGGQLVKTHPRKVRAKQTDFGDYLIRRSPSTCEPPAVVPQAGRGDRPVVRVLIGEVLADNALYRLRAAQGVIGLADRRDPSRLEAACVKAITAGDPSYRTVRSILAVDTERDELPATAGSRRRSV
jgi:hypothetical protein